MFFANAIRKGRSMTSSSITGTMLPPPLTPDSLKQLHICQIAPGQWQVSVLSLNGTLTVPDPKSKMAPLNHEQLAALVRKLLCL